MKVHRVTKNIKEINFEGVWAELEKKKKNNPETITPKIFDTNTSFHFK